MRRLTLLMLAVPLTVEAGTGYPVARPTLSAPQREQREAAFRERNPRAWMKVVVDPHGFVSEVESADPSRLPAGATWNATELADLRNVLRANADLFGIDPAAVQRLGESGIVTEEAAAGISDGWIWARVVEDPLSHVRSLLIQSRPWLNVHPILDAHEAASRVVGQRYTVTATHVPGVQLDCNMGRRRADCRSPPRRVITRRLVLAETDVVSTMSVLEIDEHVRVIACIDASPLVPLAGGSVLDSGWGAHDEIELHPIGHAPRLPLVIDAVTAQVLDLHPQDCAGALHRHD